MAKTALITGISGQDGSYLAELLLVKGYEVHGIVRRSSLITTDRIDHLYQDPHEQDVHLHLHYGDLTDGSQLARLIRTVTPDEVYNLAAQSHVAVSFQQPEYTGNVDGLGVLRLLEAIRDSGVDTRLYQAGTSEMFGDAASPQSESTEFRPRSPYAAAKLYAYWLVRNYREAYGIHAMTGLLFNHESPRRGETFVTRKITRAVAAIAADRQETLYLGNLDAKRDWGHARDYVRAMHLLVQHEEPLDLVIATGETHTVREFASRAFARVGLDWREFVQIDPAYFRPTEVEHLHGDPSRAQEVLGWKPETSFQELIAEMVDGDLAAHDLDLAAARARVSDHRGADVRVDPDGPIDVEAVNAPGNGPQPPGGESVGTGVAGSASSDREPLCVVEGDAS